MTSQNLANLAKIGSLKAEPFDAKEFDGFLESARSSLQDASRPELALASRFYLAYNAAHALSLAALRLHGYRSEKRYVVFQCLEHTLGLGPEVWRVLTLSHDRRNLGEYEGHLEVSEQLVADLLRVTQMLMGKVSVAKMPAG